MKKYLFCIAVAAIAIVLSSCENLEPSESMRLQAWQSQVSHYMGKSVYQEGNKVVMLTEKGVEEEFEVTKVSEGGVYIAKELRAGESEKKLPYVMVYVELQLESDENTLQIYVTQNAKTDRESDVICGAIAMNEGIKDDMLVINNFDVEQPTITVSGKNGMTAVFGRDEGLKLLTDTVGHTWTRK